MRQRARRVIQSLAQEPRPAGSKELQDQPGLYRIRLDRWRIIYQIDDENQIVTLLRIRLKTGPETYEDL
jgi:mRNA interferase RelE/StbE